MHRNTSHFNENHFEPSLLEMILTRCAFFLFGQSVYKDFADRLPIQGHESVLDFGCGMGTVAFYAAKKLPEGNLVCADISHRWLKLCGQTLRRYHHVHLLNLNTQSLSQSAGFDVIYCHFVLHDLTVRELDQAIPQLIGILHSGGYFVFREPMNETVKLNHIKRLIAQNGLSLVHSRITDIPTMGNALESTYLKEKSEDLKCCN